MRRRLSMHLTVKPFDQTIQEYDAFLARPELKPHLTFMHTWEWGEVLRQESSAFERLGVYDDSETLVGVANIARYPLKFGGYFWYSPRGIALDYSNTRLVTAAYKALRDYVKQKGGAFLRVDPDLKRGDPAEAAIDELKPGQAAIFTQAERVWCVDLQKDAESTLAWMKEHGMRSNVPRYLRKAKNAGVTVRASDDPEDLEKLIDILNKLNQRKGGIGKHKDSHYRVQFPLLAPKGYEKVFLAEKDGQILAGALIAIYGREASYLHGASTDVERDLSAPHTMHVEIMNYCIANRPEVERYNFWGIVGEKNRTPSHPRHGYSEFKRSFGGYKEKYMRSRDFYYNWFVWKLDWFVNKYRTWKHKND